MTADDIIQELGLARHPEGGWYVETFRDARADGARAHSTAIYFLLKAGESSHWHRVDAAELWLFHAGAPLELGLSEDGVTSRTVRVGTDLKAGERPQAIVPRGAWQTARTTGAWTLVSCTVAPGFEFGGFELAPAGWSPGSR